MNKSPFSTIFPITEKHIAELENLCNWGEKLGLRFEFPPNTDFPEAVNVVIFAKEKAPFTIFYGAFCPDLVNACIYNVCAIMDGLPEQAILDFWNSHCGESRGAEIGIRERFEAWYARGN